MTVVCIDLEGVLIPEIWHCVASYTGISELKLTTRDVADYDELMRMRLTILAQHHVKMDVIGSIIGRMKCLEGAQDFLRTLRSKREVIVVSDTFYPFTAHFMRQLEWPTLFCNDLVIAENGDITDYVLRQKDGKKYVVEKIALLGFDTYATGDSYNDVSMILGARRGSFFTPPRSMIQKYPHVKVCTNYTELLDDILHADDTCR